jgi:hypothetical protein
MKEVTTPNCGRENDLIGFLYGELNDVEARSFQRHVRDCASCNAELAAFGNVRESVVAWRNECLGGFVSTPIADSPVASAGHQKPSALAALREFFNLSPLWMKGALAFASILFCLFAALAIARFRDKQPTPIVTHPSNGYSQQEFNARVERRVQDELQRQKNSAERTPAPADVLKASDQTAPQRVAGSRNGVASNVPSQKARRPLSRTEREQLAADLRLISTKNDSDLELLDDRINQ